MSDIIRLLPDAIANQIAAGEVVQRPASVVKELMENAIDAGAGSILLVVKDAGKSLIQVVDDGAGMTENDARLAFERHATSKLTHSDDLWSIKTKGFRGEALASIAAIAQVELKTRKKDSDLGTRLLVEGSEIREQEACQTATGSQFLVRNIFFNTPARRNFLKSDTVESRHIIDEFQRVALAHPGIAFRMVNNGNELFNLPAGSLRQRIVAVFGPKYNQRLVPVEVETDIVSIKGYVGKPEFARKSRGEQFFFVNDRFIKSSFFHHAVMGAYEQLIPSDSFPLYFLYLEVDPSQIDVNIHPTKTEVKFRDERAIYAILNSAVKQAFGKYHVAPVLDFEQELGIQIPPPDPSRPLQMPQVNINPNYNPFREDQEKAHRSSGLAARIGERVKAPANWEDLYELSRSFDQRTDQPKEVMSLDLPESGEEDYRVMFQLGGRYIVTRLRSGLVLIHVSRAHERILFEQYAQAIHEGTGNSQQLLFPEQLNLSAGDAAALEAHVDELHSVGFEIERFGPRDFIVRGVPVELTDEHIPSLIERFLSGVEHGTKDLPLLEKVALALARSSRARGNKSMSDAEMHDLTDRLFACRMPQYDPSGRPVIVTFGIDELDEKFD